MANYSNNGCPHFKDLVIDQNDLHRFISVKPIMISSGEQNTAVLIIKQV